MTNIFFSLYSSPVIMIVMLSLFYGCQKSTPPIEYYSLYGSGPTIPSSQLQSAHTIGIGPVVISEILKHDKIATGGPDSPYYFSESHRWSGDLEQDIGRIVAESLADSFGPEQVKNFPWPTQFRPTVKINLSVLFMSGVLGHQARLAVHWTVTETNKRQETTSILHKADLSSIPKNKTYSSWVEAQRTNIAILTQKIALSIKQLPQP